MKMYSHICITVICIFALTFVGCTSKQGSFSFEVNGVAADVSPDFDAEYDGYVLVISAGRAFPNLSHLSIFIIANGPGTYTCNEGTDAGNQGACTSDNHHLSNEGNMAWYMVTGDQYTGANSILHTTNKDNTGTVIITSFDKENKMVSGTFEFRAVQKEPAGPSVVNLKGSFENITFK
jgi:hypothetical protein